VEREDSAKLLERIRENTIDKICEIASKDLSVSNRQNAIALLGQIGNSSAIETFIEIVMRTDDRDYAQVRHVLEEALAGPDSKLLKQHKDEIRDRLVELLKDPKEKVKERSRSIFRKLREQL